MDRKALIALLPDDKREAADALLDSLQEDARTAGRNAAGYDGRQAAKALKEAEAARDQLQARVSELESQASGASEATAKVRDLESSLKAIQAERDRMAPIVKAHRDGILRAAVVRAANLRDDLYADALVARLGLALGEDDTLPEEATAKLTEWASDPANRERVKTQSNHPSGPRLDQSAPISDPVARWRAKLPAHEREALKS